MRIAISGIGIAGPTVAYWLGKAGHEVLLIEKWPELRRGGYVIDFWGSGYDIAEKMGMLGRIRSQGYQVKEVRYVDRHGRQRGGFRIDVLDRIMQGRFTSLRRSDLSAEIYGSLEGVETIFGDSIASIKDDGESVLVSFEHAAARSFDLVIGADGLHSRVRELVFGPESEFSVSLGYHVAAFEVEGYGPRDELAYVSHAIPGREVSRFSMRDEKTLFLFVFRDEYLPAELQPTLEGRKSVLKNVFADAGWECPQILAALESVTSLYFDSVSQIQMNGWTKRRIALVGDAAACVSLIAGEGTGLAMTEAYVLAGELQACRGDHNAAFARYQERMMPFLKQKQRAARRFASAFAPKSSTGIAVRNLFTRLLRFPFVADFFIGRNLRDDIVLPRYEF